MANPITTAELTSQIASGQRVVMRGGLAVISHGHSRPTFDADAWLDPSLESVAWAQALLEVTDRVPSLRIVSIGDWKIVPPDRLAEIIERDGVVRILGANQPLDLFRNPNELEMAEFDAVWERGEPLDDGTRVPDVIDLLVTKQETGRDKDIQDIAFLEAKAERLYLEQLPTASRDRAREMLDRFLTPKVAEAAVAHPDPEIRALGLGFVRELAEDGDPFAGDLLTRFEAG